MEIERELEAEIGNLELEIEMPEPEMNEPEVSEPEVNRRNSRRKR